MAMFVYCINLLRKQESDLKCIYLAITELLFTRRPQLRANDEIYKNMKYLQFRRQSDILIAIVVSVDSLLAQKVNHTLCGEHLHRLNEALRSCQLFAKCALWLLSHHSRTALHVK